MLHAFGPARPSVDCWQTGGWLMSFDITEWCFDTYYYGLRLSLNPA